MAENRKNSSLSKIIELVVFHVGDIVCGMNINDIQEIKKVEEITKVHHSPDYVRGVTNLRGQIVTVIDVRKKLHMEINKQLDMMQVIFVNNTGEPIGLLVDQVEDAVMVDEKNIEPPPANIKDVQGKYLTGVYKMEGLIVSVLDKDKVIAKDEVLVH